MGWRELCVKEETMGAWLVNQLRAWVLLVLVSWFGGWALVDYTLQAGDVRVASAVSEVVRG
ncbi:MAG: hypothetical protein H6922_01785 [Pseudomonadaceae bacterium]|nr:hypothetical protein [Pseudomonadaceae bacterium]